MLSYEDITAMLLGERLGLTAYFATVARNYHLAEDVFQDVCVKAIRHEAGFETKAHLMNWARAIGRNRTIDLLRARDGKYFGLSEQVLEALATVWPDRSSSNAPSRQDALQYCIEILTPNSKEILKLRYFEGRSGGDVALSLGRKIETVYQALARIHKTLGECVQNRLAVEAES